MIKGMAVSALCNNVAKEPLSFMLRKQSKLIAIMLLLVLGQKVGLRLWMHHWLHEDKTVTSKSFPVSAQLHPTCDCFDDAMMPMEGAATFELTVPIQTYTLGIVAYLPAIPTVEKIFEARRGPPTQC
jgi:hypothetical protein